MQCVHWRTEPEKNDGQGRAWAQGQTYLLASETPQLLHLPVRLPGPWGTDFSLIAVVWGLQNIGKVPAKLQILSECSMDDLFMLHKTK